MTDESSPDENVVYLPDRSTRPASTEPDSAEVVEGELVDPAEDAEIDRRLQSARMLAVREASARGAVTLAHRIHESDKPAQAGKGLVRHSVYVATGAGVVARRWWEAHSNSRYERMMRAAEAAGDYERVAEWEERENRARRDRHTRAMDWLKAPIELAKAIAVGAAAVAGLLLAVGIMLAISDGDAGLVLAPIGAVIDAVRWTWWFLFAYGTLLFTLFLVGVLCCLWDQGRRHGQTPAWVSKMADGDEVAEGGIMVTADGIVAALQHLPIPGLKAAFKAGWTPRFELTPTREGQGAFKGFRAIFDLPMGVTPKMISDAGDVLAKNLNRIPVESWPSDYGQEQGGKAGYLNLYVADAGVMDKPTPAYPLLHEGTADTFAGVPVGITQRGDVVNLVLNGGNFVFGGQPGQGKSNAGRVTMLGAALDPLCELRVHVFALNGDFDAYQPRLSRYHKGATTEHVELATEHLRELHEEVSRREQRLAEIGAKKLTRAVAEQHPDLRPVVTFFSECHELFSHGEHGQEAAELAVAVVKRGRKSGVVLGFDTQSSRAGAIPGQLVENVGINGCFAVKTWRSNDGFLGDGSFAAGIRATELRFNVDRGTMVATGVSDELYEIVRTYFIDVNDDTGWDQAGEIIERSLAQLADGTPTEHEASQPLQVEQDRDLLEDVAEVLGNEPAPAAQVADALKTAHPRWRPYQGLISKRLVSRLADEYGVKVPSTGNKYPIDPHTVRSRLTELSTRDLDGEDGVS